MLQLLIEMTMENAPSNLQLNVIEHQLIDIMGIKFHGYSM
jgi:hypothetical protein